MLKKEPLAFTAVQDAKYSLFTVELKEKALSTTCFGIDGKIECI